MEETQSDQFNPIPISGSRWAQHVSGEEVQFGPGIAGEVTARGDIYISDSGVFAAAANKDVRIAESFAAVCVAGAELEVRESINGLMVAGGNVRLEESINLAAMVGGNQEVHNSFVGVSLASHATYHDGSRVLMTTLQALILGAALGAAYAVVSWLLGRNAE